MQRVEVADGHFLQGQQIRREVRQRQAGVGVFQNAGEANNLRQADIQRSTGQRAFTGDAADAADATAAAASSAALPPPAQPSVSSSSS